MRRMGLWMICLAALLATGCNFRPMKDPGNVYYLRIYVNEALLNVTTGFYDDYVSSTMGVSNPAYERPKYTSPEILRVCLFDAKTGAIAAERYLRGQGSDALGHYWDGYVTLEPGEYNLSAYNFGTEATIIEGEYDYKGLRCFTHEIANSVKTGFRSSGENAVPIRYDADPLFVAGGADCTLESWSDGRPVSVPLSGGEGLVATEHQGVDTLRNSAGEPWFRAESVVKTYYIQIGVNGSQWVSSSACVLDGMAEGTSLPKRNFPEEEETAIYFEMHSGSYPDGYRSGVTNYHCIWGHFGTFGKLPDKESSLTVTFEFITTYGKRYTVPMDITAEFQNADALEHQWLLIDRTITIPGPGTQDPGSGGMAPHVDNWNDIENEFEI